jgi:hypothetical protein
MGSLRPQFTTIQENSAIGLSGTKNALTCMRDVFSGNIMRFSCCIRIEKSESRQETVPKAE